MILINIIKENDLSKISLFYDNSMQKYFLVKELSRECLVIYTKIREIDSEFFPKVEKIEVFDDKIIVTEEYIEAVPLSEYIELNTKFSNKQLQKIAINIASALRVLHNNMIIHRDIKPSNVMIFDDFSVKLIDFNASRKFDYNKKNDTVLLGTHGYAPPEQFGFSQTDSRADIYSFGATFYELLTGKNNFLIAFDYNGKFKKVIKKCIEIDPKHRFKDGKSLYNALVKLRFKPMITTCFMFAVLAMIVGLYSMSSFFINTAFSDKNLDDYGPFISEALDNQIDYKEDTSSNVVLKADVNEVLQVKPSSSNIENSVSSEETLHTEEIPVIEQVFEEDELFTTVPTAYYFTSGIEVGRVFISFPLNSKGELTYPSYIPNSWISISKSDGTPIKVTGDFYCGLNGDGIIIVCLSNSSQINATVDDFYGSKISFEQKETNNVIKYNDGRIFEGFSNMPIIVR